MTNNQLTDEELQTLIIELQQTAYRLNGTNSAYLMSDAIKPLRELQERRKAAMDGEPVVFTDERNLHHIAMGRETSLIWGKQNSEAGDIPLYRHAQPAPERDQIRREHAEWSQATFGDVGPVGPLKHLSKEALEAAVDPHDPLEWADMQFLFWDAQRRMGISDEFITRAMVEKLAINKARQWPEPKDGEPRLHIKEQPAPVTTSEEHRQLRDLVMMVKMLCRTIRKYNPESQQAADYTAYLQKEGLISAADCLRGSDPKETDTEDRRG